MDFSLLLRSFGAKKIRWNKAGNRVTFEKSPEADFAPLISRYLILLSPPRNRRAFLLHRLRASALPQVSFGVSNVS